MYEFEREREMEKEREREMEKEKTTMQIISLYYILYSIRFDNKFTHCTNLSSLLLLLPSSSLILDAMNLAATYVVPAVAK